MPISPEALELENRNIGVHGEPTLAKAYEILKEQWEGGDRDRELGLHLLFLGWYCQDEPGHLTGFVKSDGVKLELMKTFIEVHTYFEPTIHQDAEMLYIVGLAAHLSWFMFPIDDSGWEQLAEKYRALYRALVPSGIDPGIFAGRGAYGEYYEQQAKAVGGF